MEKTEYFPVVDEQGRVAGKASRQECHAGSFLLHPVVHLHVLNRNGELYLQKRSMKKDIQPGRWDTAVGGHVDFGEEVCDALLREAREELGMTGFMPVFMRSYKFVSDREAELVYTYYTISDATPTPDLDEVDEGRFWTSAEIEEVMGQGVFTPNFESEYRRLLAEGLLPVG